MNNKNNHKYDLVLILEYFRSSTAYLSIIKALSKDFSVGIYQIELTKFDKDKNIIGQKDFLRLCESLGADIIESKQVETDVLMIPQRPLDKSNIIEIKDNIKTKLTTLMLGFAYPGIEKMENLLDYFKFYKAYAIDKPFLEFLIDKRNSTNKYDDLNIVEVGLPYKKYPIHANFKTDYIFAMPTQFSFPYESDKWLFLEVVYFLFQKIDSDKIIVHKPHNGSEKDQFSSIRARRLLKNLSFIPKLNKVLKFIIKHFPFKIIKQSAEKLYTAYLYDEVLNRTITMEEAGGQSYLALEAYLPGVSIGVIGGASNTMWGTLYNELKFYNCVDFKNQKRDGKNKLYGNKNPDKYLDLNLQYFMVPFCESKLNFDEGLWRIPSTGSKSGDLIQQIKLDILHTRKNL